MCILYCIWPLRKCFYGESNVFGNYQPIGSRETLHYCQDLIEALKKIGTNSFYSELPEDENLKDSGLQPRDFAYWEEHKIKDSLQPGWEEP